MKFSLGEKVAFLNDSGFGIVKTHLKSNKYIIENEFGIELTIHESHLVKILSENYLNKIVYKDKVSIEKKLRTPIEISEIDLHLENWMIDFKHLTNRDILQFQLRKADEFVRQIIQKRIKQGVIIHGVGEGILRNEVRALLSKYLGVTTSDADNQKYGLGATLVEINYNLR